MGISAAARLELAKSGEQDGFRVGGGCQTRSTVGVAIFLPDVVMLLTGEVFQLRHLI